MKKIFVFFVLTVNLLSIAHAGRWRWTSKSKKLKGRGDCVWTIIPPSVECSVSGIPKVYNCNNIKMAPDKVKVELQNKCLKSSKERATFQNRR